MIVTDVVKDIDVLAKELTCPGWDSSHPGNTAERREIRLSRPSYQMPVTGPLFDNAYAHIRKNY